MISKLAHMLVEAWENRANAPWRGSPIHDRAGKAWIAVCVGEGGGDLLVLTGEPKLTTKGFWLEDPSDLSELLSFLSQSEC